MGLFASIALNPAVKCGQNAESGGVGDGGVSSRTTAGPCCPAKMKVSLDLVMEASLTGSTETVKALSDMARDAFIR
jgi:hypothetical protein